MIFIKMNFCESIILLPILDYFTFKLFMQEYVSLVTNVEIWEFKVGPPLPPPSLQLCPTLCDPTDCSLPGFSVHGILQARTLEWVAISFSNAWKWKVKVKSFSSVWLLATPQTAAYQAPPSMGFSGQQYWSGVPLPSPKVLLRKCFFKFARELKFIILNY